MKITSLQSENVKRLKAVSMEVNGNSTVVIGGMNAQGKSSLLDSIEYCLAGKSSIPSEPIRHGEDEARVVIETEEYRIKRTFKSDKSSLVVESLDGAKYSSPQKLLDKLVGDFTFDPLEFSRKKPKDQLAMLQGLVGLDFSQLDAEKKELYDERTAVNRDVKALQAKLDDLPKDVPERVSIAGLMKQVEEIRANNAKNEDQRKEVYECDRIIIALEQKLDDEKVELERMKAAVQAQQAMIAELAGRIESNKAEYAKLRASVGELKDQDTAELLEQIEKAEEINRLAAKGEERDAVAKELKARTADSETLTKRINQIEQEKADAMAAAKFPVDGLAFDENGVLLNGLPFEQASSAEQWKVSVAMGFSMNPELKVMLIRDGSLLDPASMKVLSDMAEAEGGQVWVERVSEGDECTVIIEDGSIKE